MPAFLPVKCLPLLLCKWRLGREFMLMGMGGFLEVYAAALFVLIISDISEAARSLLDGQNIKNN